MNMQFLIQYAFSLLGTNYRWGGDDPIKGWDCSGLVQEILMAAGIIARGTPKMSAAMIYDFLSKQGSQGVYGPGAISFYGKSLRDISHVGFCLDSNHMIHAASGDSTTTTEDKAAQQNAFVRMDLIRYRRDFLTTVKPFYRAP